MTVFQEVGAESENCYYVWNSRPYSGQKIEICVEAKNSVSETVNDCVIVSVNNDSQTKQFEREKISDEKKFNVRIIKPEQGNVETGAVIIEFIITELEENESHES